MKDSIPDWIRLLTEFLCPAINGVALMFPHLVILYLLPHIQQLFPHVQFYLGLFPHVVLTQNGSYLHFHSNHSTCLIFTVVISYFHSISSPF